MQPFSIHVPDTVLADLRERLVRTRWPDASPHAPWTQGTDLGYLRGLVDYWRTGFDWRASEAALNRFTQFEAAVDGLRLHFIHQRSTHAHARPLLVVHGWPGGVYEFHKLIPRLTQPEQFGGDPKDAFHVIAPSLPGYGFSEAPKQPGENTRAMARRFHTLMTETLGYPHYGVQGGDWGAVVATWLAFDQRGPVTGLHLNMPGLRANLDPAAAPLTDEEKAYFKTWERMRAEEFGYMAIQGSRPQSIGYGLNDSPAGLAAWLVEKYRAWSDCGGDPERAITRDEMLTMITIYWATGTITSSMRLYYEFRTGREGLPQGKRVECPTGFADFPKEILRAPERWVRRAYNIVRWTPMPRGGHFAALEQPDALAEDVRAFFREMPRQ
ncbi:MAG TPA: epoxide hydrolase [bacterium]